jgi:cobalt-zinc-cadmium efflux system protein
MNSHAGHSHVHAHGAAVPIDPNTDARPLWAALGLLAAFMAGEVVAGALAHSLALLSDAAHMLTDVAALALSIVALHLAARPPRGGLTYGLKRAEILSALANGVTLLVLAGFIVAEAVHRLVDPPRVQGGTVLGVALVGAAVNVTAAWQLQRANRRSLNIEGSVRHVITDLYAFVGTAVAAVVILTTGFDRADPIASLVVAALMLRSSVSLIRDASRILLEAAPVGLNPDEIGAALAAHPHVAEVHDLHVWELTSGFPALSAHVLVHEGDDCHAIRLDLERLLADRFALAHTTLQVDHEKPPLFIPAGALRRRRSPPPAHDQD